MSKYIEPFAEAVSKRIEYLKDHDSQEWHGSDLMLGGLKGLEPDLIYRIKVPIKDNKTQEDHRNKIIFCYNRGRKPSVRRYLDKYFEKETLDQLMSLL